MDGLGGELAQHRSHVTDVELEVPVVHEQRHGRHDQGDHPAARQYRYAAAACPQMFVECPYRPRAKLPIWNAPRTWPLWARGVSDQPDSHFATRTACHPNEQVRRVWWPQNAQWMAWTRWWTVYGLLCELESRGTMRMPRRTPTATAARRRIRLR
jgi:hypothetical protein